MKLFASSAGLCATAFALVWTLSGSLAHAHSSERVRVLSDHEITAATGRSITEWGDSWWKWAFRHPETLGDTTGEFGELGDVRGPVFFAEGSSGDPFKASVDVPRGEYVLLPIAAFIWTFFDPCAEIRCARKIINDNFIKGIRDVFVSIDGKPVGDLASHLVKVDRNNPQVFLVDAGPIDEDGYGGILPAFQGGYWLMLEPLPPGPHYVVFGATIPELDPITGEPTGGTIKLRSQLTLQHAACRHHRDCNRGE
jgi:hypothetical protein